MSSQIAVRIRDAILAALDEASGAGCFGSRAAAVRQGLDRLLDEEREREIAESYRRAYLDRPEEEGLGEVGLALAADRIREFDGHQR